MVKGWCTENSIVGRLDRRADAWRHGLHRGDRRRAASARRPHHHHLRGHHGIQANDLVGRKIARDGGAAATKLIATIRATAKELSASGDADIARLAQGLEGPAARLEKAVAWVLETHAADPAGAAAAAVPLLHLFGLTIGGWLIVTQANKAARELTSGQYEESFLRAKIAFAKHYAAHMLPHTEAYFVAATQGAGDVALFDAALV